ncbi:tRNA (adenosine(37)-N6)-dimethylallyltransferase MiaA [Rhodobacter sp. KR11]|uniref:tRNA (adenosine(37)-N6)-dimethylallyltransferase n=1 Tax=Rhodobacter sp. KR11 TaxID=2974588 RepID=UPI0022225532|nr:tRNA (adenosine(37)-N6)-dimethylallyltransferase MiaA [Rhodobacter sp. KR11]MCW1917714.1 tRNA (adenosine(37)-N6)-dimethylallyltransferase MiaA [Rhodobacter sp. KR11]
MKEISRERPVLIAGPTASGKSALALELAARDGRVVVNADALQVYAQWRVLTARPSVAEEARAPHALYGHVGRVAYSVGDWLRDVAGLLDQPVVIVGGTGLYFMALTEGLAEVPPVPPEVRAQGDALRLGDFAAMVAGLDPETAAKTDLKNPMRVQRGWEVLTATGRGLAWWQAQTPAPLVPVGAAEALVFRPSVPWLDARIARRFSVMLEEGALEEARLALSHWEPLAPWARAIGAPELVAHLQGRMTLPQAQEAATLASRQYAKRQRTWFRARMGDWQPVTPG